MIEVVKKDMPNFFVEAFTVADGRVFTETREVIVPPESRILNVEVTPSAEKYKPGEKAVVKVKLTGPDGKPFVGSTVVSIYDKAVEYISGGSNVPEIKAFFWKWRRQHHPSDREQPGPPRIQPRSPERDRDGVPRHVRAVGRRGSRRRRQEQSLASSRSGAGRRRAGRRR